VQPSKGFLTRLAKEEIAPIEFCRSLVLKGCKRPKAKTINLCRYVFTTMDAECRLRTYGAVM